MSKNYITIPKTVTILLSLAVVLNLARISIYNSTAHIYILWNMFLAFLPLVVSLILIMYENKKQLTKLRLIIGGVVWLLLIPNAPYIVTDLIHIGVGRTVPVLFDAFVLFSSALVGLVMGMYSIFHIEKILLARYGKKATSYMVTIIILLISFGVYLGRFLRWNSWDVFINPMSLFEDVKEAIVYPASHNAVFIYTGLFFIFIFMSYMAWKHRSES